MKSKTLGLIVLLVFVIGNMCMAAGIIWNHVTIKNTVVVDNDEYYYVDYNGNRICSNYDNRFKRINDTIFFVNDTGVIYMQNGGNYSKVKRGMLDAIVGQDLTASDCYTYFGGDDYVANFERVKGFATKERTIYENIASGDLDNQAIMIGDSYSYLFNLHSKKTWPYVCCPGYNVKQVKNELIDRIPDNKYKYCVIFIGGNDIMQQTDPYVFIVDLQELINEIKDKGMRVVFISYLDMNYDVAPKIFQSFKTKHKDYNKIIRSVITNNNIPCVECYDLLEKYGYYTETDFIHPNEKFYPELEERILRILN